MFWTFWWDLPTLRTKVRGVSASCTQWVVGFFDLFLVTFGAAGRHSQWLIFVVFDLPIEYVFTASTNTCNKGKLFSHSNPTVYTFANNTIRVRILPSIVRFCTAFCWGVRPCKPALKANVFWCFCALFLKASKTHSDSKYKKNIS